MRDRASILAGSGFHARCFLTRKVQITASAGLLRLGTPAGTGGDGEKTVIEIICISPVRTPINFNSDFLNLSTGHLKRYTRTIARQLPGIDIRSTYDAEAGNLQYSTVDEDATNGSLKAILQLNIADLTPISADIDERVELSDLSVSIYDNTLSLISYRMRSRKNIIDDNSYQRISNEISISIYDYIWKNLIWVIYDEYIKLNKEKDLYHQIDDSDKSVFREYPKYVIFDDLSALSRTEPPPHGVLWTTRCILCTEDDHETLGIDPESYRYYGAAKVRIAEGVICISHEGKESYSGILRTISTFQYFSALFETVYSNSRVYFSKSLHKSTNKSVRRRIGDVSFFHISMTQFVNNYRAAIYGLQGPRRELGRELADAYQMETLIANMTQQVDNLRARFAALRTRQQARFAVAIELALLVIGAMGLTEVLINFYWFRFSDEFERTSEIIPLLTYFGSIPIDVSFGAILLVIALLAYVLLRSRK